MAMVPRATRGSAGALGSAAMALAAVVVISLLYAAEQGCAKRKIGNLAANLQASLDRSNRLAGELETSLKESERRVAALYLERGQSACEKGDIARGMVWMVESWRAAAKAGDTPWQHAARANLAAWQSQYPGLMGVFSHAGAREKCSVQSRRQELGYGERRWHGTAVERRDRPAHGRAAGASKIGHSRGI